MRNRGIEMEIRIYFECLEQAYHFVYPAISEALKHFGKNNSIKLVKLRGNCECYSKKIAPIIFWKEPDAVISCVKDGVEYPLLLIEFSNAVFTEDHELQRFDGLVAAAKNNCFYAKISPSSKPSPSEHGGNIEFDHAIPYAAIQKKYGKTFFHFEWKCDERGVVEVEENCPSCPRRIEPFEVLLTTIIHQAFEKDLSKEWMDAVTDILRENSFFLKWLIRLEKTPNIDITKLNTSRTKWVNEDAILRKGVLELKLNRFGHAMDPERGMLAYYGSISENVVSKMLFSRENDAWYKDTPEEEQIRRYIRENGLSNAYDFLLCFSLGSGLYNNKNFMDIIKQYEGQTSRVATIDLTDFILTNFFDLNKALRTIFGYSSLFAIEDDDGQKRVIFRWKPYNEPTFFQKYSDATSIYERRILEEDDVTYITVHNILKPNGYKIIAVSYPGAQADRRILIEPGTGRRQPRKYVDVISFLPRKVTSLQENKGLFSPIEVKNSINEMSMYKRDVKYMKGLKEFQKMFAPESLETVVKIGVGFWSNESFSVSTVKDLDLRDLDYFVYITNDRKSWSIWSTGKNDMFKITNGTVDIPRTYDVKAHVQPSFSLSEWMREATKPERT
jgi:hypothetical protein